MMNFGCKSQYFRDYRNSVDHNLLNSSRLIFTTKSIYLANLHNSGISGNLVLLVWGTTIIFNMWSNNTDL